MEGCIDQLEIGKLQESLSKMERALQLSDRRINDLKQNLKLAWDDQAQILQAHPARGEDLQTEFAKGG
ncbi:unnamed protein product [Heterosigma akashiwo]